MIDYETFEIKNIKMSVAKDDTFFIMTFRNGDYWDYPTLKKLKENYIDENKNIVEIGAHIGTSTCFYSKCTNKKVIAYEPQTNIYELLEHNVKQNNLNNVELKKEAIFYKNDKVFMDVLDTHKISDQGFNRGGVSLGVNGEATKCSTLNDLNIDDCGFLHIDAQGAEQHIFYSAMDFIAKHRPIILWENNIVYEKSLVNRVNLDKSIPNAVRTFNIEKALSDLGYNHFDRWAGIDTLSIPNKIQKVEKIEKPIESKSNTAYIDLPANGLGCHILSMLIGNVWCSNNQKYFTYKSLPDVHHNNIGKDYNKNIEELFGFNLMEKPKADSIKIPYNDIYWNTNIEKHHISYLKNLFNKNNKYPKTSIPWIIHIRRNDINKKEHTERYIEYDRYNQIISKIRENYKGKILIVSDGDHKEILTNIVDNNVEIDTKSNSLETFCKMVYCKNLVVGWSSYSFSAGVLNDNNVYKDILENHNHNYYHLIPEYWLSLEEKKDKSVAIVGMCKNVGEYLEVNVFKMIEKISNKFNKVYLYIYTNDNEDNTLTLLEKFKEDKKHLFKDFTLEVESNVTDKNRFDLTILVYGRNKCLEYARQKNVDYMCVIDLDECLYDCDESNLDEMIEYIENNNSVVAISKAQAKNDFYDKFSLRTPKFTQCIHRVKDNKPIWSYELPDKFTKVNSYFGGICFYKMNKIPSEAKYDNKDKKNIYCCEHVAFNEMLEGEHFIFVNNFTTNTKV